MQSWRLITTFLMSLSLVACVTPGQLKKDYSLQQKKVAVVSELGNSFHHNIVGTTVFTNNITESNVKEWNINHLAADHLIKLLTAKGINATEIESDFLTPLDRSSPYKIQDVSTSVLEKVKPLGYDSLVLIAPVTSELYPLFNPGYGMMTRYTFGKPVSCIYSIFLVEVYDLESSDKVGWEWMNAQQGPCDFKAGYSLPIRENFEAYSAQEKMELRNMVETRVIESLNAALKSLDLFHESNAN